MEENFREEALTLAAINLDEPVVSHTTDSGSGSGSLSNEENLHDGFIIQNNIATADGNPGQKDQDTEKKNHQLQWTEKYNSRIAKLRLEQLEANDEMEVNKIGRLIKAYTDSMNELKGLTSTTTHNSDNRNHNKN